MEGERAGARPLRPGAGVDAAARAAARARGALAATVRREPARRVRAGGDDLRGIDVGVDDVVVLLDLVEVDLVAEARRLEEVAGVAPEVRHLGELVAVALEVAVVDHVEAHERGEEPDVGLGDRLAHQEAAVGEALLEPVHRGPEPVVGVLVGFLRPGEAASVDAVVDLGEDALHDLLHLLAEVGGPQVGSTRTLVLAPLEEQVMGDLREVVGDDLAGLDVDDRRHGDATRVAGLAGEVGLLEALDAEHRVHAAGQGQPCAHGWGRGRRTWFSPQSRG